MAMSYTRLAGELSPPFEIFQRISHASPQANHLFPSPFKSNCTKFMFAQEGQVLDARLVGWSLFAEIT